LVASPPRKIGPYLVEREIGRGGMGIVYLARDPRLDRPVAIKALPDEFAADAERLARFTREAKLLASLNHPNIAAIHGLEEIDGARYLILEYVSGENLAERLMRGALAVDDALSVCTQIAAGMEAAHDAGVIHRDLKPGNVILTADGTAKVLDFGLARGGGDASDSSSTLSHSPTMSLSATRAGVLLGTAAYMSPEQARGRSVDRRADVWSFGCVLFECLTGRVAFAGETVSDTIASVLKSDPEWSALPNATPRAIERLLRRCLEKEARRRLRDIGDARIEIEEALAALRSGVRDDRSLSQSAPPAPLWRRAAPWALAAVTSALALLPVLRAQSPDRSGAPALATHVAILFPPDMPVDVGSNMEGIGISPDGRRIVYIDDGNQTWELAVRALDDYAVHRLAGTQWSDNPFFSPDGEWLAYFAGEALRKVPVTGGAPVKLCDVARAAPGGSWGPDGTIVFAGGWSGGLHRVSSGGGEAREFTTLDSTRGEVSHRWPHFLPDGRHVLFTVKTANMEQFDDALIQVCDIETGEAKMLVDGGSFARYTAGHLLYLRSGTIFAAPFDLDRLEITGAARPVVHGVLHWPASGCGWYAVSKNGDLLYAASAPRAGLANLVWVDRQGNQAPTPITSEKRVYQAVRISPDGHSIVAWAGAANDKLWRIDVESGNVARLTSGAGNDNSPVWSPDGTRIAYFSDLEGNGDVAILTLDGGQSERIVEGPLQDRPTGFSADGTIVAFDRQEQKTGVDIWFQPLTGDRTPRPFLATPFDEGLLTFSPDGRWVAFVSAEASDGDVYVQPYPGPGAKTQVSRGGGWAPRWSFDSRELFFLSGDSLAVVSVGAGSGRPFGTPKTLFDAGRYRAGERGSYDIDPDGSRFVFVDGDSVPPAPSYLHLVLNWGAQLASNSGAGR
jgi:serine/threonine protein kinase/Tol biopolymer transport system component